MSKDMLGIAVRKLVTLPSPTLGIVCDLLEKLSDQEWVGSTKKFLRKENPWEAPTALDLKVWKTIKLGTGGLKTSADFLAALKEQKFQTSDWAKDILGKSEFTVATQETEVDLVVVTVAELGFKENAIRSDIYRRAQELGLDLCPAEVGPQLRLQYQDQPKGEWLIIAMNPITDSGGDLHVFNVAHDGLGLWLSSDFGNPGYFWRAGHRWVFLRRKPARNA